MVNVDLSNSIPFKNESSVEIGTEIAISPIWLYWMWKFEWLKRTESPISTLKGIVISEFIEDDFPIIDNANFGEESLPLLILYNIQTKEWRNLSQPVLRDSEFMYLTKFGVPVAQLYAHAGYIVDKQSVEFLWEDYEPNWERLERAANLRLAKALLDKRCGWYLEL